MCAKVELRGLVRMGICLSMLLFAGGSQAFPKIQTWKTSQGMPVFYMETKGLPMVDIRVVFDAGSSRDGDDFGIAHLTSALLDSGAGAWGADELSARLEGVGALLSTGAGRDSAYVSLRTLTDPEKLKVSLETFQEVMTHPTFAEKDFEREKNRALMAIKQQAENPEELAELGYMKALYGEHPYAHAPEGTLETLSKLSREQIQSFFRRYYTRGNGIVAIVGDLDRQAAERVADELVKGMGVAERASPIADPVKPHGQVILKEFPSAQTHIFAGQLGMRINDPDYFPLYVGNHILGGSGLVSKIMEEVREKRGYAYSAYSYFFPMKALGPFQIGLQTKNGQADDALKVAIDTLKGFVEQGPSEAELVAAKRNIIGGFVLRLDSNSKLVGEIANIGFFQRPLDYLDTFQEKINAVTRQDILRLFGQRIQPNDLVVMKVGGVKRQSGDTQK